MKWPSWKQMWHGHELGSFCRTCWSILNRFNSVVMLLRLSFGVGDDVNVADFRPANPSSIEPDIDAGRIRGDRTHSAAFPFMSSTNKFVQLHNPFD